MSKKVLLAKIRLNAMEGFISNALIDLDISHDVFVSMNNVFREYNDMKEAIKNSKNIDLDNMCI